ncbi:MAG: sporulation protein YabP [Clostridiales bacterium]|nr:sporulation protein YabP [Clostridiales bacterium]
MTELKQGRHNAILENRNKLVLTGITDVDNFDDTSVSLFTELGELIIRGRKLHINVMNVETGDLTVEGDICSLVYGDKDRRKKANAFGKLFR